MRIIFENIKTLFVESIGLIGGLIWGKNSNWDYEPLILIAVSFIGIVLFFILRFLPSHEDRPIVELEFVSKGTSRSAPSLIADISPRDETGQSYVIEVGGTYLFDVKKRYDLVIRNNSKNNAYGLTIYKLKDTYPLSFEKRYNSLDPLTIEKPFSIPFVYEVIRPMTHNGAETLIKSDVPEDFENLILIAEYKNESRRTYYTKFRPLNNNIHLERFSEIQYYEKL